MDYVIVSNHYLNHKYTIPMSNLLRDRLNLKIEILNSIKKIYTMNKYDTYKELIRLDNLINFRVISYMITRKYTSTGRKVYSDNCDFNLKDKPMILIYDELNKRIEMIREYRKYVELIFGRFFIDANIKDREKVVYSNKGKYAYVPIKR